MKKITGLELNRMLQQAAANLENNKQSLNDLNVFPVPDGDTGTNMAMTISAAAKILEPDTEKSVTLIADKISSSLLRAARGNSGVILSLLFRGFAKSLKGLEDADGAAFANSLSEGVEAAYKAVLKPAEGTILTVARVAAEEAKLLAADGETDILVILKTTIQAAESALALTPSQNPVLAKAGVVDAGGQGWIYILEGMKVALEGGTIARVAVSETASESPEMRVNIDEIIFGYCTEFIILLGEQRKDATRLLSFLNSQGDSVVMVEDDDIIKVHVHTNAPGRVLQEAIRYGALDRIKIDNMRVQNEALGGESAEVGEAAPERKYGFVAVSAGSGISEVFIDLGVDKIVTGGQTMNPSTDDILKAIRQIPAEVVFVLPNNKNIIMAAEQAIGLTEKMVVVIPTKTIPQGITAMLSFDPDAEISDNTENMTTAAAAVRTGQVTFAARNSDFDGMHISEGEYLALNESKLCKNAPDLKVVLDTLLTDMRLQEASFVTVFAGADVNDEAQAVLDGLLKERLPAGAELTVMRGEQPVYYFIISVE